MAQEACRLKAQLQEKEREIAALKNKLAQLEEVMLNSVNWPVLKCFHK